MSNPVIVRNGVTKELSPQVFGKKSPHAGKSFFAPEISEESFQDDVKWLGFDTVENLINKGMRNVFASIYLDNINAETGEFDQEGWAADAADFTAGAAKLSDIEEKIDDLQALQQSYTVENENFGALDENGKLTEEAQRLNDLVMANNKKIKSLRAQRDEIKAIYMARAAKRAEKKAAQEAVSA